MSRAAAVLGLYALTVALLVAVLASVFVTPIATFGPLGPVYFTGALAMFVLPVFVSIYDALNEPANVPGWLLLTPFALSIVATGAAVLVADYEPVVRTVVDGFSLTVLQVGAAILAFTVIVLVGLPLVVRRRAWRRVHQATGTLESPEGLPPDEDSPLGTVDDRFVADVPNRVDLRTVNDAAPGVYVVDDGRRAVLAFSEGALDVLSERERQAVLARELARVLERAAVPSFWASAISLAVGAALDPVATEPYDARAGGTVRLPFWFVAPLKLLAAVAVLLVLFVVPVWSLSALLPVSGPILVVAYATAVVLAAFGLAKAATWVARRVATANVRTADEHGAVLADDADALASALRTLDEAREERSGSGEEDDGPLGALETLSDCPTDRVPLSERLDGLEDVGDRLDDRSSAAPAATTGNASS